MKLSNQHKSKSKDRNTITIHDKLIIKQTIGKGTFGKVKLGINKETNTKVAIKILEKSRIVAKEDYDRVERELTILSKFSHQNVIQTYEIINNADNIYIIMEYCEGGELFNYIVEKQYLSEKEASVFYYQLIKGLEYIHSHNVVHRDLKPENLLLGKDKMIKIIDFGLSNYYTGKLLRTPCGSPCYASPEMVSGNKYNGCYIDVWSTGIILFAMLCGYLPFEDDNNEILFQKILDCRLHYPSHISSNAKGLLMKIIVTDPEKRIKIKEIKKHSFYLQGRALFNVEHSINSHSSNAQLSNNDLEKVRNLVLNTQMNYKNKNDNMIGRSNENDNYNNKNNIHNNCNTEGGSMTVNDRISRNTKKRELTYNVDEEIFNHMYYPIKTEHIVKNKTVDNTHNSSHNNSNSNNNNHNYYNFRNGINNNHEYYTVTSGNHTSKTHKTNLLSNVNNVAKQVMNNFNTTKTISANESNNNNNNNRRRNERNEVNYFLFQDQNLINRNHNTNHNHNSKANPLSPRSNLITKNANQDNSSVKVQYSNQPSNKKTNQIVKDIKLDIGSDISDYVKIKERSQRSTTAKTNQRISYSTFRNSVNIVSLNGPSALANKIIQEHTSLSPKQRPRNNVNTNAMPHHHNYKSFQTEGVYQNNQNNINININSVHSPRMNNYITLDTNANVNRKDFNSTGVFEPKKKETLYSDYLHSNKASSDIASVNQVKYIQSYTINKDSITPMHQLSSNNTSNTNTHNNTRTNIEYNIPDYIEKINRKILSNKMKDNNNMMYLSTDIKKNGSNNKKSNAGNKLNKILNSRNIQTTVEPLVSYSRKKHLTSASLLPSSYAKHGFNTSLNYLKQQGKNMSRG